MKYLVRHCKNCDYHELQIKSLTITAIFWTIELWEWDLKFVWEMGFKAIRLPFAEFHWYRR
jgi:hypothetical protein